MVGGSVPDRLRARRGAPVRQRAGPRGRRPALGRPPASTAEVLDGLRAPRPPARAGWPASASTRGRSTTACSTRRAGCSATPFHYRDERTRRPAPDWSHDGRRSRDLYAATGCSSCRSTPSTSWPPTPASHRARDRLLLIPDLLGVLADRRRRSPSDERLDDAACSTSRSGEWATSSSPSRSACPRGPARRLRDPGDVIGPLLPEVGEAVGAAPASRSSPSARTTPRPRSSACRRPATTSAYISFGTWSLVGVELDAPVLTEAAARPTSPTRAGSTARSASCAT